MVLVFCICFLAYQQIIQPSCQSSELDDYKADSTVVSSQEVKLDIPVDFDKLKKANKDIYAWIVVPGTQVDYPVLQHKSNNAYYLNRTINKEWSAYGSIFTEDYNNKDFNDLGTLKSSAMSSFLTKTDI